MRDWSDYIKTYTTSLGSNMKLYKAENVTISSEHREELSFTKADPAEFNFWMHDD